MAERYTELQFYLHCDGFRIQILSMNHVRFGQNFNYKWSLKKPYDLFMRL